MQLDAKKYLHDIVRAGRAVQQFAMGKSFEDYAADSMLRAAVERQFEIVGEALAQLVRVDSKVATRISDYKRIIAFRNILIHGYAELDHRIVWNVLELKLPTLLAEAEGLLKASD